MKELIKTILREFVIEEQQRWTKKMVSDAASKYNSRVEFRNNEPRAYRAALRLDKMEPGFFDEITQHMEVLWQKKWDYKNLLDLARKFESRVEFRQKEPLAYAAAYDKGFLDQITDFLKWERPKVWSKENVENVAKKYNTKVEFQKNEPSAYQVAWRNKWIDDVTKHMVPVGNLYKRMVYAWEFPDNTVYVGLTGNKKIRAWSHTNQPKSPVYRYKKLTGLNPKMVEITTKYIDAADAQAEEENTKLKYIENGWKVLNKAKTGGLGGSIIKWTADEVEKEAKKYPTKVEFQKGSPGAFNASRNLGIYDKVTAHMDWKGGTQWTYDMLEKEAKKYNTRSEFNKKNKRAYSAAQSRGILDDITKHMEWFGGEKWDWGKILDLTKKIKTYKELDSKFPGATAWVRNNNKSDELKKIIKYEWEQKWDYDKIKQISSNYTSRSKFTQDYPGAARAAKNKGWWDDITKHMDILRTPWTREMVLDLSKQFKTVNQFRKEYPNAYAWAHREKILPEIIKNMEKLVINWTPELIDNELDKYDNYTDFKKGSKKAYDILRYRKQLQYARDFYLNKEKK